ncbi:hypothetical protein B0H19DRAFT_305128 [Mycena capillaripes]|nr:hypothetical protein B0H19DRAFT_305128 [Mycena capillaripes]
MGKVTVYCPISGCSPEIPRALWWHNVGIRPSTGEDEAVDEGEPSPGLLVKQALRSLMNDAEKEGQSAVAAIGPICEDDDLSEEAEDLSTEDIQNLPDANIRIQPCYINDEYWDFGFVARGGDNPDDKAYIVSYGGNLMVQNTALDILRVATAGRMTPERFWRTAMTLGRDSVAIKGIHYGKISELSYVQEQDPKVIPEMEIEEIVALEECGDVVKIKQIIVHRGSFWIWMRPDIFPSRAEDPDAEEPAHIEAPTQLHKVAVVESLPPELFTVVVSHIHTLYDLLSFAATSHKLRHLLLGVPSNRDANARAWIRRQAPWYIPTRGGNAKEDGTGGDVERVDGTDIILSWSYLRQCCASGSMRNRKRIWLVAELLEEKAIELGLLSPH